MNILKYLFAQTAVSATDPVSSPADSCPSEFIFDEVETLAVEQLTHVSHAVFHTVSSAPVYQNSDVAVSIYVEHITDAEVAENDLGWSLALQTRH